MKEIKASYVYPDGSETVHFTIEPKALDELQEVLNPVPREDPDWMHRPCQYVPRRRV